MDIEARIIKIVTEQLGMRRGDVTADSTREVLGMDSLDDIEVLMAIEEEFDLEISDADAEKLRTIKDAVLYVANNTSHEEEAPAEQLKAPIPETPTDQQLASVCLSYRHDYGLMGSIERSTLRSLAIDWWRCIARELNEPSQHSMVKAVAARDKASEQPSAEMQDWAKLQQEFAEAQDAKA